MSRAKPPALDWLPLPFDLDQAPSLGVLAVVAAALDVVRMALMAEHPELVDPERPRWVQRSAGLIPAAAILRLADRLHEAISAYCRAVLPPPPTTPVPDDDIPF